jgi:2-polyprenyl-3-methyl-5-hydroxy-6-metoxy-1,4-benzoquinol methylase
MQLRSAPGGTLVSGVPGRFRTIVDLHEELFRTGTVLDIGARDGRLSQHVGRECTVVSLDLAPGPSVGVVATLEAGLPFRSRSFDTVLALDVLEHVDRMLLAFREVLRVARTSAVIALPNAYELSYRLRYLAGRPLSSKYVLSDRAVSGGDRHRWVFTPEEATRFVERNARTEGCAVVDVRYLTLGYSSAPMRLSQAVLEWLQVGKNLFGGTVVYYLRRT